MASNNGFDQRNILGISEGYEQVDQFGEKLWDDGLEFTYGPGLNDPSFPATEWDQSVSTYETYFPTTPTEWEPPQDIVANIKHESQAGTYPLASNSLTASQQEKLRNIAMPPHLKYRGQQDSPKSTASLQSNVTSSPECNNRKRKNSADEDEEEEAESSGGQHAPKKTSHNMIEKRYRTNLNDKIAELRDSVPSLRIMTKSARGEDTAEDREELQGLTPAHKLNKATVLSKATEYIAHLEKRNKRLQEDNEQQKARLDAFVKLFNSGAMGMAVSPQYTQPFHMPPGYQTPGPSPDIEGMIQVPEAMRRLHSQMNHSTYQVPQQQIPQSQHHQRAPHGRQNGVGGYLNKFMIGSLAGLMFLEGFGEVEPDTDTPNSRGLSALPFQAIRSISRTLHSALDFRIAGHHMSAAHTLQYLKILLVLGAFLYAFVPSWLASQSPSPSRKGKVASMTENPSLASPIQVRRQAWLTAIQTVWVPRHNFFLEAAALCLKTLKLSIRNTIGADGFALLTGITEKQELARVKAWTIALDAQLVGGDIEISKSRLTLTLLASSTLPDTPARLMLKALHIRVLLWEFGHSGFYGLSMGREVAAKLARSSWNKAKNLQRLITHTKTQGEEELPGYLATLLEEECDDVLVDSICQRAYNLAWNIPPSHNSIDVVNGMDRVVDDFSIRSPLDAVAAWWSCLVLQRTLAHALECKELNSVTQASIADELTLAIKAAPIGSSARISALVARAVLVKEKRGANIAAAWKALGPFESPEDEGTQVITLINTGISSSSLADSKMALWCAAAIAHIDRNPWPNNPERVRHIVNTLAPTNLTLLGFTAQFLLAERLDKHDALAKSCSMALERMAGNLRLWIGGKEGEKTGLEKEVKRGLVNSCLRITRRTVGMEEKDAGYETMEEDEDGLQC